MTALERVEDVIFSGLPFTYMVLSGANDDAGGDESKDRLADRTIQKYRRKGMIAFTREGRNVVWTLTALGRLEAHLRALDARDAAK